MDKNAYLQQLLTQLQFDEAPAGSALVIFQDEKCEVVACTGMAGHGKLWTPDTLSLNYSTGKGILATLVHVLVTAGVLDIDTPVCFYWKEFACQGKQNITLREVMTHQAGLYDIYSLVDDAKDMLDWSGMIERVAAMPKCEPVPLSSAAKRLYLSSLKNGVDTIAGTSQHQANNLCYQSVYSALVYGWVLGGVIEKATKLSLPEALANYLTQPLGIADSCYFGVPKTRVDEVACLAKDFMPATQTLDEQNTTNNENDVQKYQKLPLYECWQKHVEQQQGFTNQDDLLGFLTPEKINKLYFDPKLMDLTAYKAALKLPSKAAINYLDKQMLQACIPAANAVASAKAMATIYAMLANGGSWQGQQLIDSITFKQLSQVHTTAFDAIMAVTSASSTRHLPSMNWRLGYHRLLSVCHDEPTFKHAFGHMGYNGSVAWCDPSRNLAMAFVHNYDVTMFNDVRQFVISDAVLTLFS